MKQRTNMRCDHTVWVRLVKDRNDLALQVTDRPRRLIAQLRDSLAGEPTELVFMLGHSRKVAALRDLAVAPYSTNRGEVHVVAGSLQDPTSRTPVDRPLLIVETDVLLHNKVPRGPTQTECHERVRHRLPQAAQAAGAKHAVSWAINRLILPLAGVVCIFIKDVGLCSVAEHLASWLADEPPAEGSVLPWLLLVDEGCSGRSEDETVNEVQTLVSKNSHEELSLRTRFAGITVADLGTTGQVRERPQWQDFRAKLSNIVQRVQEDRRKTCRLFSAEALCRLMDHSSHSVPSMQAPWDLLSVTRLRRPVSPYLEAGVADFLGQIDSTETLKSFAIPVVASSILFDHYMRNMHCVWPRPPARAQLTVQALTSRKYLTSYTENK